MTKNQETENAVPFMDVTVSRQDLSWLEFLQELERFDPRAMQAVLMCLALKALRGERLHLQLPERAGFREWLAEPSKQLLLPATLQQSGGTSGALVLEYQMGVRQWQASVHT